MPQQQGQTAHFLPSGVCLESLEVESDTESQAEDLEHHILFTHTQDDAHSMASSSQSSRSYSGSYQNDVDSLFQAVSSHREALYSQTVPRSVTPSQLEDQEQPLNLAMQNCITPTKTENSDPELDPLTPTANLKMLLSAASPEIRNREKLKESFHKSQGEIDICEDKRLHICIENIQEPTSKKTGKKTNSKKTGKIADFEGDDEIVGDTGPIVGRKEKSLGLLCQRFLMRYPEYPPVCGKMEISLDEAARDLRVERRRIYDIVNVLESVEMVSRMAKNRYTWHGRTNLKHTLAKLKALALLEGMGDVIEKVRDHELSRELRKEEHSRSASSSNKREPLKFKDTCNQQTKAIQDHLRKDKSLGIMSQKFLMLFLVSKNKTVNLDMSAKILIGDPNIDMTETGKFKTKIRRLYDIANILTSLGLIHKVHVTEVRGRKPAFRYVGPNIDDVSDIPACSGDGFHRPSSRHSMLDCIQNPNVCTLLSGSHHNSPTAQAIPSRNNTNTGKKPFMRHSSLDQICQVVEQERNRLYNESRSQPTSPVKISPEPASMSHSSRALPMQATCSSLGGSGKQLLVIRGSNQPPVGASSGITVQRMPLTMEQAAAVQNSAGGISEVKYMLQGKVLGASPASGSGGMVSIVNGKVSRPAPVGRLQILRVHPSEAAVLRNGQGVKRCLERELPVDNSQCYFGVKRQRIDEVIPSQPKPRPSPRALNFDSLKSSPVTTLSFPSPLASPVMVSSSSTTSRGDHHAPTLQLNCTSSPVMLLPPTVRPTMVQAGSTVLTSSSLLSPLMTSAVPVSPLVTSTVSAYAGGTTPMATSSGASSSTTPICIPGASLRALRSIQPTNAILNLGPHLMAESEADIKGPPPRILQVPLSALDTRSSSMQPQCFTFNASTLASLSAEQQSNGDLVLTPRDRIITSDMIAAGLTPGSGTRLTPNSFFRSTPGGPPNVSITQPLRTDGPTSAFKFVSAQTGKEITLTTDTFNAARKLQLTKLSPCS